MASTVNVLLSSFPGLSLPKTSSFSIPSTASLQDLRNEVSSLLPTGLSIQQLRLTTLSNKEIIASPTAISTLLQRSYEGSKPGLITLRLSAPLCGGKGGFGSQLRAAGGRMSSRRKGNKEEDNGSSRNLDGRRLRTVNEAKALAEYLALKPGMDKRAKEARRERWEKVVEAAERTQEELRNGKGKARIDGEWMEDKEEVAERAREAVARAMKDGTWTDSLAGVDVHHGSSTSGSAGSASPSDEDSDMDDTPSRDVGSSGVKCVPTAPVGSTANRALARRKFFGFDDDEDDEFLSDEEDGDGEEKEEEGTAGKA
ncbi:hypothetical protein KEM54_006370 [Ascosphaera aggregata]|nr:hypothetical protein KEM54_006370 [Ascosphaera aggregata]